MWSQSDEWREESRKRATKILQQTVTTQTKPQVITNNLLHDMGIAYRNEEPFVYYSIDNYLQDFNLAIEVMGDYWHSSPIKYPETFNATQARVISRDKAKHTYIKNHYGIDILYLWERDIMTNIPLCKALIASYVENAGKLNNYNSFNYTLKEGILTLNNNIIKTHQEKNAKLMS